MLVIGSTGKTGSRVAAKLADLGHIVRYGSRRSATPFDWENPGAWHAALAGVPAVYITYFPDMVYPGAEEIIEALTKIAEDVGVNRLVLLSVRGEYHAQRCEDIVRQSGLEYTLGGAAWFAQITLEAFHAEMTKIGGALIAGVPTGVCRETLEGRNEWLGDGVQRALGRQPRDFVDFCQAAAVAGAWDQAA